VSESGAKAVSVAAHPRARASVRRVRAWTAIAAFVLVLVLSRRAGVPGEEAVLRALVAGLVGNLLGWMCALAVWRQLVVAELRAAHEARRERLRARADAESEAGS
jgi:hypothetical protein